jgi:hypothetical protein
MLEILNTTRYYEDVHSKIDFLPQSNVIHCELINFIADENYQKIMTELLSVSKDLKAYSWIVDSRRYYGTSYEMQEWTNNFWGGLAADSGLRSMAVVLPRSIYGYFTVLNSLGQTFNSAVNVKKFLDYEIAFDWLQKVTVASHCAA